ncbi:CvpA family protein [Aurantiacibacter suaedae]|uniref:CvpA family protein n=1 Tax=Aurantiacibacter suaedae TaxID=2545755 RepID=UPI0010F7F506|nr:CvpA family protein [Aurantiacibacter suaedae]
MVGFDIIVLVIVGLCAIGGFLRGFVQEVLSLGAWAAAILAIHFLHPDLTAAIYAFIGSPTTSAILAFALLLLVPLVVIKFSANWLGKRSRASVLGPLDRVLGFGFGGLKGVVITVIAFSLLVLGYDMVWGTKGRPLWLIEARSYQFVDASSKALVEIIAERRARLTDGEAETDL